MICQVRTAAFDISCQMVLAGWPFDMFCQIGIDRGAYSTFQVEQTCTQTHAVQAKPFDTTCQMNFNIQTALTPFTKTHEQLHNNTHEKLVTTVHCLSSV